MQYHSDFWERGVVGKVIVRERYGEIVAHSTEEVYPGIFRSVGKKRIFDTAKLALADCKKRRDKKIATLEKKIAELKSLQYIIEE